MTGKSLVRLSDQELLQLVLGLGQSLTDLFLVGDDIYSNKNVDGRGEVDDYKQVSLGTPDHHLQLVNFLKRIDAESYSSMETFVDFLARGREWRALDHELGDVFRKYGTEDSFLETGDYAHADDDLGFPEHRVACKAAFLRPDLIAEVQSILRPYAREWKVVFDVFTLNGEHKSAVEVFGDRTASSDPTNFDD